MTKGASQLSKPRIVFLARQMRGTRFPQKIAAAAPILPASPASREATPQLSTLRFPARTWIAPPPARRGCLGVRRVGPWKRCRSGAGQWMKGGPGKGVRGRRGGGGAGGNPPAPPRPRHPLPGEEGRGELEWGDGGMEGEPSSVG